MTAMFAVAMFGVSGNICAMKRNFDTMTRQEAKDINRMLHRDDKGRLYCNKLTPKMKDIGKEKSRIYIVENEKPSLIEKSSIEQFSLIQKRKKACIEYEENRKKVATKLINCELKRENIITGTRTRIKKEIPNAYVSSNCIGYYLA
jgi:hypothetical protein